MQMVTSSMDFPKLSVKFACLSKRLDTNFFECYDNLFRCISYSFLISILLFYFQISVCRFAFIIDFTEKHATNELNKEIVNTSSVTDLESVQMKRLKAFQTHTLPACKFLDDVNKLVVVCNII